MTIGYGSSAHYYLLILFLICFSSIQLKAQDDAADEVKQLGGDGYRKGQYPGLGRAASQILYSPNKVKFSGYAELANVFNGGETRDISSGDLELYFSQLYKIGRYTPMWQLTSLNVLKVHLIP